MKSPDICYCTCTGNPVIHDCKILQIRKLLSIHYTLSAITFLKSTKMPYVNFLDPHPTFLYFSLFLSSYELHREVFIHPSLGKSFC